MNFVLSGALAFGTALLSAAVATGALWTTRRVFDREQRATANRLRITGSGADGAVTWGDVGSGSYVVQETGDAFVTDIQAENEVPGPDGQFMSVLVEYYSYGLTQARISFYTSQVISAVGVFVILSGVALAIWRADTNGEMFASIVASSAGVVSTIVGQLVHRRADLALQHMASQTESLRTDMRTERSGAQAVALLTEVANPDVKARLQAGLIMKLAGAEMPEVGASTTGVAPAPPGESTQQQ